MMSPHEKSTSTDPIAPREDNGLPPNALGTSEAVYVRSLQAVGQKILADQIDISKDFCRLMIVVSISAIPLYLGLFILAIPYDIDVGKTKGLLLLVPALIFLLSAILFSLGFLPAATRSRLNSLDEIERVRRKIIVQRHRYTALGSLCFISGSTLGIVAIIKARL